MWRSSRVILVIVGLALLGTPALALPSEECIPLRWPDTWIESPDTLELLRDTPIDCLIIPFPTAVSEKNANQRQPLASLIKRAHAMDLQVLGVVASGADLRQVTADRNCTGLDGIVFTDGTSREGDLRKLVPPGLRVVSGTSSGVTARVQATKGDSARATASSEPWIDMNLWLVHSLRAERSGPVWLNFDLDNPSVTDYLRTIGDVAAEGGRWVVSLDADLADGLRRKNIESVAAWRRIASYLAFFKEHADWHDLQSAGSLGVIQDPDNKDPEMFGETLNLVTRRRIPYRLILRPSLSADSLQGLNAVLATGVPAPTTSERALLTQFVERGGLLVAGPRWSGEKPPTGEYSVSTSGQGRTVIYRDESPDPEALAKDMLFLLGKNRMAVRLLNGPSVLCPVRIAPDGSRLLVQLINYASEPAEAVTVRVAGNWRSARILSPGEAPVEAPLERTSESVQTRIRSIHIYSALLLEK